MLNIQFIIAHYIIHLPLIIYSMKKILSFILIINMFMISLAQVVSFKSTPIKFFNTAFRMDLYKNDKNEVILNPLSHAMFKSDPFYDAQSHNGKLNLYHYNSDLNFVNNSETNFSDYSMLQTFSLGTENAAILESYNNDIWTLAYAAFSDSKMSANQGKKLCEFPIGSKRNKNLSVIVSQNKEYFALFNAFEIKNASIINAAVYDKDFNQVWIRKGINIPAKYENIGIESATLTNQGDLLVLMESYDRQRRSITQYEMAVLSINGEKNEKELVPVKGMLPMHSKILVNNNSFIISGLYLLSDTKGYQGLYSVVSEIETPDFSKIESIKFTSKFINDFSFKPNYKGNKPLEMENIRIREIHPTADLGYIIIAEEQLITQFSSQKTLVDYYYDDGSILYAKVNKEGSFDFVHSIPRLNYSKNTGGNVNSFSSFANENSVYLFYNFGSKFENLPLDKVKKNSFPSKSNAIMCVEIDIKTGKNKRFSILPANQKALWIERQVLPLGDKEFAFVARTLSKRFLCRVELQ